MRGRSFQIVALAFIAGCGDSQPATWEGERLTVSSSDGIELCGGTLGFLDRYIDHAYSYWTDSAPPDDLALRLDLRLDGAPGPPGSASVNDNFAWISDQNVMIHELSHLVVGWDDGISAPSLGEGVAEAFGPVDLAGVWGPLLEHPVGYAFRTREEFYYPEGQFSARYYGPSAQMVRFLIDRYGIATVRAAYREARHDQTSDEIEGAFVRVFGDELYDGFEDFAVGPQCGLQLWECSDAVVPSRALPVSVARTTDCTTDSDFMGATSADGDAWFPAHASIVELSSPTDVVVDTTDNATVLRMNCIASCDEAPPAPVITLDEYSGMGNTIFESSWEPGRYFLSIRPIDPSLPFSASIRVAG